MSNAGRASVLAQALRAALAGDARTVELACTEDVRVWTPFLTASSRDELVTLVAAMDALAPCEVEIVPLDVGGDFACAEWSVRIPRNGLLEGAGVAEISDSSGLLSPEESSESVVTVHGVTVAEFRDDRICAVRQYSDEPAVLGLASAPTS
jgi:SnoaL-like domain